MHDALVKRLVLSRETTDEAMGMLVLRFLAVVSLEVKGSWGETAALTDEGLRAVSSLPALTPLYHSNANVTEALLALRTLRTGFTHPPVHTRWRLGRR